MSRTVDARAKRDAGPSDRSVPRTIEVYDVSATDPTGDLVDYGGMAQGDLQQIAALMGALSGLRDAERRLSTASRRFMHLNETDMRAVHFLIVCANKAVTATPSTIAAHLEISTASTTKLLDRLEKGGHITRAPHPSDRRALAITLSPQTRQVAMDTVGRQQARRFHAAARLDSAERDVVIRFLEDMTQEIDLREEAWAQS